MNCKKEMGYYSSVCKKLNKLITLETIIPSKESRPQVTNTASFISFVDISNKLQICLFQWKSQDINLLL